MSPQRLGMTFQRWRRKRKLTQVELARRAGISSHLPGSDRISREVAIDRDPRENREGVKSRYREAAEVVAGGSHEPSRAERLARQPLRAQRCGVLVTELPE